MKIVYRIYWDNGAEACGTFPHVKFDSEKEAQKYAKQLTRENRAQRIWSRDGFAEAIEVEEPDEDDIEEAAAAEEQSLDYFNHYIAGDR